MRNVKRINWDVFKYTFSKVIPGLTGFMSVFVFMRLVGADQYGRYALVITVANMTSSFMGGWLRQSLLRYYGLFVRQATALKKSIFIALLLSVCIVFVGAGLVQFFFANFGYSSIDCFTISVLICVLIIYNVKLALLQAQIRPSQIVFLEFVRSVLAFGLPLFLVFLVVKSYLSIVWGVFFAYFFSLMFCWNWFPANYSDENSCEGEILSTPETLKKFWDYGWPLSLWFSCLVMLQVTDRYFIQYYFSFADTGIYSGIYDIVMRSYSLLLFPVTLAVHPRIMNSWNNKAKEDAMAMIVWGLKIQTILFVPIIIFYAFYSKPLGNFLIDNVDDSVATLLPLLAIGGFLWQLALLVHKPLELEGKTRWMLIAMLVSLLINIIGNYFYLPLYGIKVVAYTTIASALGYFSICLVLMMKLRSGVQKNFKNGSC